MQLFLSERTPTFYNFSPQTVVLTWWPLFRDSSYYILAVLTLIMVRCVFCQNNQWLFVKLLRLHIGSWRIYFIPSLGYLWCHSCLVSPPTLISIFTFIWSHFHRSTPTVLSVFIPTKICNFNSVPSRSDWCQHHLPQMTFITIGKMRVSSSTSGILQHVK